MVRSVQCLDELLIDGDQVSMKGLDSLYVGPHFNRMERNFWEIAIIGVIMDAFYMAQMSEDQRLYFKDLNFGSFVSCSEWYGQLVK